MLLPVRPRFRNLHRVHLDSDFEYPIHQHLTYYEAILAHKTTYSCILNGSELTAQPGQLVLVQPGDWHQDHFRNRDNHYVLHFELGGEQEGSPVPLLRPGVLPDQQLCRSGFENGATHFELLISETQDRAAHAAAIQDCLVEALLWKIVRNLPPDALSPRFRQHSEEQDFCQRLFRIFSSAETAELSVAAIAEGMHMSRRQLTERCSQLLKLPPARALALHRIHQARRLLLTTQLSIKDISYKLGFKNPYHFSRVYKRITGKSPTESRLGDLDQGT